MFTTNEGEGWQQLGEGLMPSSAKDATHMIDGFGKIGDQVLHSAFGGASLPDLHDALGAMFGPQPVELNTALSKLPQLELFDSGSTAASSPLSGAEAAKLQIPSSEAAAHLTEVSSPLANVGKAFADIMSKMGDMFGSIAQGPMGLIGGLLNFLLTVFSEILSSVGQALAETAKTAASLAAEVWKKHLEMTG